MKIFRALAGAFVLLFCTTLSKEIGAQELLQSSSSLPRKYELQLIYIPDAPSQEYLRVIRLKDDNLFPTRGFKTLYAPTLREWVKNIPDESTIEWAPSCLRTGGEPQGKELQDFQAFCQTEGVRFIIYPSG